MNKKLLLLIFILLCIIVAYAAFAGDPACGLTGCSPIPLTTSVPTTQLISFNVSTINTTTVNFSVICGNSTNTTCFNSSSTNITVCNATNSTICDSHTVEYLNKRFNTTNATNITSVSVSTGSPALLIMVANYAASMTPLLLLAVRAQVESGIGPYRQKASEAAEFGIGIGLASYIAENQDGPPEYYGFTTKTPGNTVGVCIAKSSESDVVLREVECINTGLTVSESAKIQIVEDEYNEYLTWALTIDAGLDLASSRCLWGVTQLTNTPSGFLQNKPTGTVLDLGPNQRCKVGDILPTKNPPTTEGGNTFGTVLSTGTIEDLVVGGLIFLMLSYGDGVIIEQPVELGTIPASSTAGQSLGASRPTSLSSQAAEDIDVAGKKISSPAVPILIGVEVGIDSGIVVNEYKQINVNMHDDAETVLGCVEGVCNLGAASDQDGDFIVHRINSVRAVEKSFTFSGSTLNVNAPPIAVSENPTVFGMQTVNGSRFMVFQGSSAVSAFEVGNMSVTDAAIIRAVSTGGHAGDFMEWVAAGPDLGNNSAFLDFFNTSLTLFADNPNGTTRFTTDKQVVIATYNPDINILNFQLDFQSFNGTFDSTNGTCINCSFDGANDPLAGGNGWCQAEVEKVWGMFQNYNLTISLVADRAINLSSLNLVCRSYADTIAINSNCTDLSNYTDTVGTCFTPNVPAAYSAYATVVGGNAVWINLTALAAPGYNLTNMPFGSIAPDAACEQIACEVVGSWVPGNTQEFTVNKTITATAI